MGVKLLSKEKKKIANLKNAKANRNACSGLASKLDIEKAYWSFLQ